MTSQTHRHAKSGHVFGFELEELSNGGVASVSEPTTGAEYRANPGDNVWHARVEFYGRWTDWFEIGLAPAESRTKAERRIAAIIDGRDWFVGAPDPVAFQTWVQGGHQIFRYREPGKRWSEELSAGAARVGEPITDLERRLYAEYRRREQIDSTVITVRAV